MQVNKKCKEDKKNYIAGIWGSQDGQAQWYLDSYQGNQALEAKNGTNLHYFH